MGKLISAVAIAVAVALYAFAQGDDSVAGIFKPAAFGVAFLSLVLAGRTFGVIVRFPLQILMLLGCWLLFADMIFTGNMGVAAIYLSLILCLAATVSYHHARFSRPEKRMIYGLFVAAVVVPALVAMIQSTVFESIFGVGSSRPMIIAAIISSALYASALIAWLPHPTPDK